MVCRCKTRRVISNMNGEAEGMAAASQTKIALKLKNKGLCGLEAEAGGAETAYLSSYLFSTMPLRGDESSL